MSSEIDNASNKVSVKLLSAGGSHGNVYSVSVYNTVSLNPGSNYVLNIAVLNPQTNQLLNIISVAGFVQEFAEGLPWLGANSFITNGVSWQSRQLPQGCNLTVKFGFTGNLPCLAGFTGIVMATN